MNQNLTGAFIGTRVEALQALMHHTTVTSILCIEGSRVHEFSIARNLPFKVLKRNDRGHAMNLIATLGEHIILSAGFPWIIDENTLNSVAGLKINSHPSKLPNFKGINSIRDALASGSDSLGVTVHYMTPEVDGGPIIIQEEFSIKGLSLPQIYELVFGRIEPKLITYALAMVTNQIVSDPKMNLRAELT